MSDFDPRPPVLGGPILGEGAMVTDVPAFAKSTDEWISRARTAWETSTYWFNSSIRQQIRRNIANFRSLHPEGSKYRHESFKARSRVFRPKSRSLARRIEAAAAVALFATSDLVTVKAWNQNDAARQNAARIKQKLLQYRLEDDATWWFLTCLGSVQDATVAGIVISHQYWKYTEVQDERYNIYRSEHSDGRVSFDVKNDRKKIIVENRPRVDLIPVERFRFDPACDWRDPAKTSPYLIYDCPTYVGVCKQEMRQGIADAVQATDFDDTYWWAIANDDYDSIRAAREGARIDKYAEKKGIPDAQSVSIRKHVHTIDGRDWYFETLGDIVMYKVPQLLTDVYPHLKEGERPFVTGIIVPEAHKVYPSAPIQLIENLQEEINDVTNLQQDNVKMSTFGRWLVKRNAAIDISTLKAGVPQSTIATDNPGQDVQELRTRDTPSTSFTDVDRLQIDLDDIAGNMTAASANSNKALNTDQTLGGMNLLEGQAGQIRELEMRVWVTTWVEPVLQQMVAMIERYESDEEILADVAADSGTTVQQVLASLQARTRVRVNVGFNATTPEKRIGRILLALKTFFGIFPQAITQASQSEIQKEIFGAVGFDDGERFFPNPEKEPPEVKALKAQVQQLMAELQGKQLELQSHERVASIGATSRVQVATINAQVQWDIAQLAHQINTNKNYLESIDRQLASQESDLHQQELQLERAALAHSIEEDERAFALKIHQAMHPQPALAGGALPRSRPPAMRVEGGDKAGTLAREHYGQLPFQEG